MKNASGFFLLLFWYTIHVLPTSAQDFQRFYGTSLDNSFSKVVKNGSHYYVLGQNESAEGALKIATVTYLDSSGFHLWTLQPDFPSVWNDAVLTPAGDLLVVGSTFPFNDSSVGIIGLVTPAGGGNFTWLRSYLEPETNRNAFIRIVINPVPQNAAFPYYILGTQTTFDNPEISKEVILNMNVNGGFNWKKMHESLNDKDSRDLKVFGSLMLVAGNNRIEGHVGQANIFIMDNTGELLSGVQFDGSNATFTDMAIAENGDIYATLTTQDNHAQVMKFTSDLGFIWAEEIPQFTSATQVRVKGTDEIFIIGTGNFLGVARKAQARQLFDEALELRYSDSGSGSNAGSFWQMPNGQIAFADSKTIEGGFGQNEAFLLLSNSELNTCDIYITAVSNQFFTPFGSSPVLPVTLFQEIPVGNDFTIFQALNWEQSVACTNAPCTVDFTYDVDCGTISFTGQSSFPNPSSWHWSFAGGSPATSTFQNPVVNFLECASYKVCLTVTGGDPETSCSICHTVTISDNVPPVAQCLGIGVTLDANCQAVITPQLIDGGSTDDCLIQSMSVSPNLVTGCGLFPVTLTVRDWCDNTATCSTMVQTIEDVPPIIRCPSNVVITDSGSSGCSSVVNNIQPTFVSDNCGEPIITYSLSGATSGTGQNTASGTIFNQGITTVIYTATDECGNSASCSFTVQVICVCNCMNNLVQNPGFYEGADAGNLDIGGESDHWIRGTQTPQIVEDSCCDAYAVQMWGWLYNGESISQGGFNFLAGHHYKVSFCGKFMQAGSAANDVSFGFKAMNSNSDPYQCTYCANIGDSPKISNGNWTPYTLSIWTPSQNYNRLNIRVFNTQGLKTWGRIDNICIQEVTYTCCADVGRFVENISNAVQIRFDERTQEGIFEIGNLPECDSIAYIDWGDGHITNGPFGGNTVRRNRFLDHLLARVNYQAQEFNQEVIPNAVCFENIFSDSIDVISLDTCICTSFSELFIRDQHGKFKQLVGSEEPPYVLDCTEIGSGYNLTGIFQCIGKDCSDDVPVMWTLTGPDKSYSGISTANPYFNIRLLASYFVQSGLYSLTLTGQCNTQSCQFDVSFMVNCPDPCPCTVQDIDDFSAAIDKSFARVMQPTYGCNIQFSSIALSDCETVNWYLDNTSTTPIGTSVANEPFNYTLPGSGTYTVIMEAIRKKADGSNCDKLMRSQNITVTCQVLPDCIDSDIDNSTFSEGAKEGNLSEPEGSPSAGTSTGWVAFSGKPKAIKDQLGSLDGWSILLYGNLDSAGVLSRLEPICLEKGTGTFSAKMKSESAKAGKRIIASTLKVFLGRGWSFPPVSYKLNECNDFNCYEIVSVVIPALDSGEWVEVQVPYDLSDWNVIDSCGGVLVRPIIYVTNVLSNDQGGAETFSYAQIDNVCLNGTLVSITDPMKEKSIHIFPNPTTGELILKFEEPTTNSGLIEIFDLYGRLMFAEELLSGNDSQTLSMDALPSGVYFIKVIEKGMTIWIEKIIKQ